MGQQRDTSQVGTHGNADGNDQSKQGRGDLTGSGGMAPGDMDREYRDKTQGDMTKPSQPDGTTPLEHDQGQRTKVR